MISCSKKALWSLVVSLFIFGVVFVGAGDTGKVYAAAASTVGVVDYGLLIDKHPDLPAANDALKAEQIKLKKEYDDKSAKLGDKEKKDLDHQLGVKLENKKIELFKAIAQKVNAAIKEVADAKGLAVVVAKNSVIYGGVDITNDVIKKFSAN